MLYEVITLFRQFNDNEIDCLLINQSGSTGASAHAIVTDKVPADKVKQRVMVILRITSYNVCYTKLLRISPEQAEAIEVNTAKRSYPETDEQKLAGIEANATVGADWETNVQNKPVTISQEQAEAIEANRITSYNVCYTKLLW